MRLPVVSGLDAVKAFTKAGWTAIRQHGSHVIMTKPGYDITLSVPQHRELKRGLMARLVKDAGLTIEEFRKLL